MRGSKTGASNLARAALVLGLIAGCTPETPTPTPAQSVPAVTPSISASSGRQIAWEPVTRLGRMLDMVHGGLGWIAVEECRPGTCDLAATVWFSSTLATWQTIELPQSGDILPVAVSVNSDGYLVAAYDTDEVGNRTDVFLQVWRSSDGRSWERVGERRLGVCEADDCPSVHGVGLAPNGAIVVGAVIQDDEDVGPSLVSDDGLAWRETTIATSSMGIDFDEIRVQGIEATPTDLFLSGWACTGSSCVMTVWSTTDGDFWAEEQSFGSAVSQLSIASDGVRRVAAMTTCPTGSACTTDVWTGLYSTVWTNVAPALDLASPEVVWTGDAFVLVGVRGDQAAGDRRFVSYVSVDGSTWTEVPNDGLGAPGNCGRTWLAGGSGALVFGVPDCAVWKGQVESAR